MKAKTKITTPTFLFRSFLKRPGGIVLLGVIGLLAAGQLVFDAYAAHRLDQPATQTVVTNLMISAVEGLVRPVPVDASTGQMQLASLHLKWPVSARFTGQILYSNTGGQDQTAELQLTSRPIMNAAKSKLWAVQTYATAAQNNRAVFNQVPNLQACTRGIQVFFTPQTELAPQWQDHGSVHLADGRTLYFYTESTCRQDLSPLLGYLKQAQSYE